MAAVDVLRQSSSRMQHQKQQQRQQQAARHSASTSMLQQRSDVVVDVEDNADWTTTTDASIPRTVSSFLSSLYAMVSENTPLAYWEGSQTLVIPDPKRFADHLLPSYFKHSNFASFIRQLNLYGFHKVANLATQELPLTTWQFEHPFFVRGRPDLLQHIRRRNKSSSAHSARPADSDSSSSEHSQQASETSEETEEQNSTKDVNSKDTNASEASNNSNINMVQLQRLLERRRHELFVTQRQLQRMEDENRRLRDRFDEQRTDAYREYLQTKNLLAFLQLVYQKRQQQKQELRQIEYNLSGASASATALPSSQKLTLLPSSDDADNVMHPGARESEEHHHHHHHHHHSPDMGVSPTSILADSPPYVPSGNVTIIRNSEEAERVEEEDDSDGNMSSSEDGDVPPPVSPPAAMDVLEESDPGALDGTFFYKDDDEEGRNSADELPDVPLLPTMMLTPSPPPSPRGQMESTSMEDIFITSMLLSSSSSVVLPPHFATTVRA